MGNKEMVYGIPYQGSKNQIAEWVVSQLPSADTFVDLFAGGCAVTHCAMRSGKYNKFIVNDIGDAPRLFLDAVNGKYRDENRWISREEFFRLKDADPYVRYCWSFGNSGKSYCYGLLSEPFKRAFHQAVLFGDLSLFVEMGVDVHDVGIPSSRPKERRIAFRHQIRKNNASILMQYERFIGRELSENSDLWHLSHLERLDRIKKLEQTAKRCDLSLQICDYQDVLLPPPTTGSVVIYCDPPYRGKTMYGNIKFDHERFYEWAKKQKNIFISEYDMPDSFAPIAERRKAKLMNGNDNSPKAVERLFVPKWQEYNPLPLFR